MAPVKASNVLLQSPNAQRAMNAMHDKLIAEGFTWDGADGYSIDLEAVPKEQLDRWFKAAASDEAFQKFLKEN